MFIHQRPAGFELDDEAAFDKKIRVGLAKSRTVFVGHFQGILLFKTDAGLSQTMSQTVLIHFFEVPMPQVPVQGQADLSYPVTYHIT